MRIFSWLFVAGIAVAVYAVIERLPAVKATLTGVKTLGEAT